MGQADRLSTGESLNLNALHQVAKTLPSSDELAGITFNLTQKNQLDDTWWVFMPGTFSSQPPALSPLENAIYQSLDDYPFQTGEAVFIDLTHLGVGGGAAESRFFQDAPNILNKLKTIIKEQSIHLTIRYLEGNQSSQFAKNGDANKNDIAQQLKQLVDENPDHVTLFFASIAPLHLPGSSDSIQAYENVISIFKQATGNQPLTKIYDQLGTKLDHVIESTINTLQEMETVSWNHSKIFAINGRQVIEGGANYWHEYQQGFTSPFDLAATVKGDSAIDAHHFCNYLWHFAKNSKGIPFNSCQIYKGGQFVAADDVIDFTAKPDNPGNMNVLSANTLGAWPAKGSIEWLGYPAVDILASILRTYLKTKNNEAIFPEIAKALYSYPVSAYSCARYLRCYAAKNAVESIKFSQQKFVLDDLITAPAVESFIQTVNKLLDIQWDGLLWPYDLIDALAHSTLKPGFSSIDVVASYYQPPGAGGYQDPISAIDFTQAISLFAGQDIKNKINYKRISSTPDVGNHSKLMIIDSDSNAVNQGRLVNIASENAYPSYNQQFSLWVEDDKAIDNLLTHFWQPLWRYSQ